MTTSISFEVEFVLNAIAKIESVSLLDVNEEISAE